MGQKGATLSHEDSWATATRVQGGDQEGWHQGSGDVNAEDRQYERHLEGGTSVTWGPAP